MHRFFLRALVGAGLFVACIEAAAGAVVIFKDGFLIQGRVRQREDLERDNGQVVSIRKGEVYLDDDARYFKFSHAQVDAVDNKDQGLDANFVRLAAPRVSRFASDVIPSVWRLEDAREWDDKWQRTVKVVTMGGQDVPVTQRLVLLTPHGARVDALRYNWSEWFLTREWDPQKVRELLYRHPEMKLKGDKSDAGRRLRACRFLTEAGWYDLADQEIKALVKAFPDEKEKTDAVREHLEKSRAIQRYEDLETAFHASRHAAVQKNLGDFPEQAANEKQLEVVRALRNQYLEANQALTDARRLLMALAPRVSPARRALYLEATQAIALELSLDDFLAGLGPDRRKGPEQVKRQRLQNFLDLARQAERDTTQGRTPAQSPTELLAAAITGWLRGKDAAVPRPETAERLWRARQAILEYQRTPRRPDRGRLLAAYQKQSEPPLPPEELAALIAFLPPPEPAGSVTGWQAHSTVRRGAIRYLVQTPAEYHAGPAYPVLLALHDWRETAQDAITRWASTAAANGYLLVAPTWPRTSGQAYGYTALEHAAVLDVLSDLRRHYQVDSDRVFLSGFGDGATMAFDVGLAHPDLFAGVLPVAGHPEQFTKTYWPNAQNLPFYVVGGGAMGKAAKDTRKMFDRWIPRGYPALQVEYKGRGREWFAAEVPAMFAWMSRKLRARAVPDLGRGGLLNEDFVTLRASDDRFYWLSALEIDPQHIIDGAWEARTTPALLEARINEGNLITVSARHIPRVGIWFALDMRDRINFDKPVTIRLNGGTAWNSRKVQTEAEVLLEDFYARGDRQRLFLARVELGRQR